MRDHTVGGDRSLPGRAVCDSLGTAGDNNLLGAVDGLLRGGGGSSINGRVFGGGSLSWG